MRVFDTLVGDPTLLPADVDRVRDVIVATGALDETDRLIGELTDQAKTALETAVIDAEAKAALAKLADDATNRDA
jgi:geranylgeranyl diphosphate synthase type I